MEYGIVVFKIQRSISLTREKFPKKRCERWGELAPQNGHWNKGMGAILGKCHWRCHKAGSEARDDERERERARAKLVRMVMMKAAGLTIYKWERKQARMLAMLLIIFVSYHQFEEIASSLFNTKLVKLVAHWNKLIRYGNGYYWITKSVIYELL
jgi:hypothetical protein